MLQNIKNNAKILKSITTNSKFAPLKLGKKVSNNKNIEHIGTVKSIDNGSMIVSIIKNSACASCLAKGACNLSEVEEKEVEVSNFGDNYEVGEQVKVFFGESLGFKAIFLGYILPFLIVLVSLVVFNQLRISEIQSGIYSLGTLLPYYFILYLARKKHKKLFTFFIEKI